MQPMWNMLHREMTPDGLGLIPGFLDDEDPRPAAAQFDTNYIAGWRHFTGFKFDPETKVLSYPGDEPIRPLACCKLRDELIFFYPHEWVLILQPDNTYEICRMD